MLKLWTVLNVLLFLVLSPTNGKVTETGARRSREDTFQSPRAGVRWRHWIQDALIEDGVLESDVAEMAKVGSEGFELLSYQSYGQRGPTLEDPTYYSYGSGNWTDVLVQYATEARKHGLRIDWAMGPNQAAGVPYEPDKVDDIGFNTELVMGKTEFLSPGTLWNGSLPEPELVPIKGYDGLVNFTAPVHTKKLEGLVAVQILPTTNRTMSTLNLNYSTVRNLLPDVQDNSFKTNYTAPAGEDTLIISFYSRRNGYPEAVPGFGGPKPGYPGSWGCYVHDHFSVEGAQKAIESNEAWVLPEALSALNADDTGDAMWTDSNEFRAQLYWSHDLAGRFENDHNYSIHFALPVLFGGRRPFGGGNTPKQVYDYGDSFNSERFRNDYKQTLTNAYLAYGSVLASYARTIGLEYSDQPAYNFPLDVGAAATVADKPESESLGQPSIDSLRQFTGGVNLAGRPIFSSEMGAQRFLAYESTMKELIHDARQAFAGGVNQVILHGYPSSTNYIQTSWPGLTPFVYEFAELHGPRQPAWQQYDQYMEMLGREMWFLRRGTPKLDVAVLHYGWDIQANSSNGAQKNFVFKTDDLTQAGYSYEYVSSYALNLPGVDVEGGILAPSGPSYKALIINHAYNITVAAATRVLNFAEAGLPVVVLGAVPNDVPGYDADGTGKANITTSFQQLLELANVAKVELEADVPMALARLGATPSAKIYTTLDSYPPIVHRRSNNGTELYFVFNQGNSNTFSIGFELGADKSSNVFVLDQLDGTVRPVAQVSMQSADNATRSNITFELATNQSVLFALTASAQYQGAVALPITISSLEGNATAIAANDSSSIELRSYSNGTASYTFSDGTPGLATFALCSLNPLNLTKWSLTIESWTATANLSSVATMKTNSSLELRDGLEAWDSLEGHYNTSGIGYYNTTFLWPSSSCENGSLANLGAELRQSSIFHTQRVWLNGQMLPVMELYNPKRDITPWILWDQENILEIEVATPLLNAINGYSDDEIESVGYPRSRKLAEGSGVQRGHQHYGLTGSVEIVPFARARLEL